MRHFGHVLPPVLAGVLLSFRRKDAKADKHVFMCYRANSIKPILRPTHSVRHGEGCIECCTPSLVRPCIMHSLPLDGVRYHEAKRAQNKKMCSSTPTPPLVCLVLGDPSKNCFACCLLFCCCFSYRKLNRKEKSFKEPFIITLHADLRPFYKGVQ